MKKQSKLYLGTNTKMYKTIAQTVEFLSGLRDRTADISREELELFVIPSFTTLERARQTDGQGVGRCGLGGRFGFCSCRLCWLLLLRRFFRLGRSCLFRLGVLATFCFFGCFRRFRSFLQF